MANKISQTTLSKVLLAKKRIAELEAEVKAGEEEILTALKDGAMVQDGVLTSYIKSWERRSPSWKSVVERELGKDYATRVLAATKPDTYTSLIIEAVA
jgi:hypothetical protein